MQIYVALVEYFGTQTKTAKALGVEQGTVSGWIRGRHRMNPVAALRAERKTKGKFKAVDLCPDLLKVAS